MAYEEKYSLQRVTADVYNVLPGCELSEYNFLMGFDTRKRYKIHKYG